MAFILESKSNRASSKYMVVLSKANGKQKCAIASCYHFVTAEEQKQEKSNVRHREHKTSVGMYCMCILVMNQTGGLNVCCLTVHIPRRWCPVYISAFWLFSSTFSSSFFSSSEEPFSSSPVFQLPCLVSSGVQRLDYSLSVYFAKPLW